MTSNSLKHAYWSRRVWDEVQTPNPAALAAAAAPFLFSLLKGWTPE